MCHPAMALNLVLASSVLRMYDPRVRSAPLTGGFDRSLSECVDHTAWTPVGAPQLAAVAVVAVALACAVAAVADARSSGWL